MDPSTWNTFIMRIDPKQVTPQIYQGGWILPDDVPALVEIGISHTLNLDLPYEDPLPFTRAGIVLHTISLIDNCLMLPQTVRDAIEVIERSISDSDHKIYIHCVEGVSRSPTIAWLYLIHTGLSPEQARTVVHPNPFLYNDGIVQGLIANRSNAS